MEENKFEKQVQQKMDELAIQPSDAVWEKIEARIEKKKRSRWVLFFLFLLFCAFLSGGYWLWNTGQRSVLESKSSEKNNLKKTTNENSIKENKTSQKRNKVIQDSENEKNNTIENTVTKKIAKKNSSQHYNYSTAAKINSKENDAIVFSKEKEVTDDISEKPISKSETVPSQKIQSTNEKMHEETKDSSYKKINKDSLPKPTLPVAMEKEKDTSKPVPAIVSVVKHNNKWKLGLLITGGISSAGKHLPVFINAPSNSSTGAVGTVPVATASPSEIKSQFGFIAGVFAEKNILSKTKLAIGINFKSFSTSNKVGARNDTTGFYNSQNYMNTSNTTINTYINHYNFIEVPVTLKIKIGKGKNVPLFWQGGFVVSQLISSNALQFNSASGYYYKDNSIFNKTQIGFNTAFYVSLFSKQENSILIGPYFYYGASGIANEGLYYKKHFVFTGLCTEIIFGK